MYSAEEGEFDASRCVLLMLLLRLYLQSSSTLNPVLKIFSTMAEATVSKSIRLIE